MRDRKNAPPAIVGGSSLIMVFAVLCLTVFTLLTLSTVQADRRLSEVTAEAVSAYYAADAEAERLFAELRSGTLPDSVRVHELLPLQSIFRVLALIPIGSHRYHCKV